jgi:hypothetical protein
MSSSAMTLSMIPMVRDITPVEPIEHGGLISSRNYQQNRDGIIFRGYIRDERATALYGRSGKPKEPSPSTGVMVDLYI